jgi:hypothetical protein
LRKGGDNAVEITSELDNHAHPALWATPPKQALPPRRGVRLSVRGVFDGQHDVQQRFGDLRVSLASVNPSVPAEFNIAPIRASDKKYHTRRR